jgi:Tfp pilus assembly protein PilF
LKSRAALLSVVVLAAACAGGEKKMPSSELYLTERMAEVLLQQGNAIEAESAFTKVLKQDPDNPEMRNGHGLALLMMHRYKDALGEFDRALKLAPGRGAFLNNRGAARMELGDFPGAEDDFLKAYDSPLAADRQAALINLGRTRLRRGMYAEAEEALTRAIRADPRSYDALMVRAAAREAQKNEAGAVADYLEALRIKPEDLSAMLRVGIGLISLKNQALGERYLRRIIELAPDSEEASNARVILGEDTTAAAPRPPGSP